MSNPSVDVQNPLSQLILVRLLGTAKTPPAASRIGKDLKPLAGLSVSKSDWQEQLATTLDDLQQAGLIEARPFRLTPLGEQRAGDILHLKESPRVDWPTLRNRYLVALALGISADDKTAFRDVGTSKGLRPAVLVRHFQLPGTAVPSEARVMHLLAWQQLQSAHDVEIPATKNISHKNILLATLLSGQKGDPVTLLAAQVTRAESNSLTHVREAVIRTFFTSTVATTPIAPAVAAETPREPTVQTNDANGGAAHSPVGTQPGTGQMPQQPMELAEFAQRVMEAARTSPTGRFGENKVFLSHVWNRFGDNGLTRPDFDRLLVEANRENLLTLSRADLVSAMDPVDVSTSEIQLSDSSFHFVRIDR